MDPRLLALEIRPLAPLAGWAPVGRRIEALSTALAGGEGVHPADVARLRRWARRWRTLHADLRAFYAETAEDSSTAGFVLARWLDNEPRPDGETLGRLHRLYRERRGAEAPFDLYPRDWRS